MRSQAGISTYGADVILPPARHRSRQLQPNDPGSTGFMMTDLDFGLLSANCAALQILTYPEQPSAVDDPIAFIQQRLRPILRIQQFTSDVPAETFVSGARTYVCRPFLIESGGDSRMVALLLDRRHGDSIE